jgi:hypothetical protein
LLKEEFKDTKDVIRIRISKKNRKHNGQKKKYKKTKNGIQNITHKTKDRVTGPPPPALALAFELDELEALPPAGTEIYIIMLYNVYV